jgi:hypothetical protein
MDSTTLAAVESLLAPAEDNSGGDNLDEAVNSMIEPDDGQSEEVEVEDEDQDDVAASSDYYDDVEIDDEDPVEAQAEDTNFIPVKVDGKEEMWTLDQLKQSAAGQAAINKRFQEVAEARKQIQQHGAALQQQQQQVAQLYQQAQQGGLQAPTPPTRELFESDPIGYMEEKLKFDEAKAQYDQNMQQYQAVQQQQTQSQRAAEQAHLQEQAEELQRYIPEFADPEKRTAFIQNTSNKAKQHYGLTDDQIGTVKTAVETRILSDAIKYRELVAKRKSVQSKGEKARPMVKAGAKKRPDSNADTRKKAQTRLQKTGSDADALSLMFKQ